MSAEEQPTAAAAALRHAATHSAAMDTIDPDEWSSSRILSALQSDSVSTLESLAGLAVSGELRDYEAMLEDEGFYVKVCSALRAAWNAHDHAVLGGVGEDEHENFLYEQQQQQRRNAGGGASLSRSIVDDEEDEEHGSPDSLTSSAWRRLSACYTLLTRVLTYPEFRAEIAGRRRGAVDVGFCNALVGRFEPKFAKKAGGSSGGGNAAVDTRTGGPLSAVTGVGGVAMSSAAMQAMTGPGGVATSSRSGSGGAPGTRAGASAQLANVPQSILSMVGIGVKFAEPDSPLPQELSLLRGLLHSIYAKFYTLRPTLRNLIASFLTRYLRQPSHPQGVNELLSVYGAIAKGFTVPVHPSHREFLLKYIMPLHQPNQMMNELSPVLSAYHEALVYVLTQFLQKDALSSTQAPHAPNGLCEVILTRILLGWPNAKAANSPKEVLLLHECEKILEFCPTAQGGDSASATAAHPPASSTAFHRIIGVFLPYLIQCISSYNHRVAERALQLWMNDKFRSACRNDRAAIFPVLLPCLVHSEKHWNKSVNKMRSIVLGIFREMDVELFKKTAHEYFVAQSNQATNLPPPSSPAESLARMDALIATLHPPSPAPLASAESELLKTQVRVAASLPQVKYSEFVFGQVLGEGSFSQVRYAKWVKKGELPSAWPEFAVKILSKELVRQQKYEANVEREIRIMSQLAHENINRLVGLCDNPTNTYLVLEYAPKGDLHNHIAALGSLDVESARFVAAEVLRALEEIHRNRIIFVDLKPENILVHSSHHIKLSDFGSSRFFSEVGQEGKKERLEGTAEYLAPEVLRGDGEAISPASDLWAFGCVLFQMLAGRTPILTEDAAKPKNARAARAAQLAADQQAAADAQAFAAMTPAEKIAHRDAEMSRHNDEQKAHLLKKMVAFESNERDELFPESFDPQARDLIQKILRPDPATRIGVRPRQTDASGSDQDSVKWEIDYSLLHSHPFFASLNFSTLPTQTAPSLSSGHALPAPDAAWSRRKNSIMWAPMPKAYEFSKEGGMVMEGIQEEREKEVATAPSSLGSSSAGGSGSTSLRAQMFSNKTGSLAAPRFSALVEGENEGAQAVSMEEGEEEGEDDEEDEDADGDANMSSMSAAPLPSASSSGVRRVRQASSRASGPTAVVEAPSASAGGQDDEDMGVIPTTLPPKPAIRPSIGLRSKLPPSGAASSGGSFAALPPKPSSMFSSVPKADATAGPTGLGMGARRMGGNTTAQALLSRILAKPPNATGQQQ